MLIVLFAKALSMKHTYDGAGNFVSGTKKVSKDNLIKYLCEAYYKINDDIVLGSSFLQVLAEHQTVTFSGALLLDRRNPTEHIQLSPIILQARSLGSAAEVL